MTTLYGIKNCDTIRKARRWLKDNAIDYHFHDVRDDGLEADRLNSWIEALGWETLLNRRGTSWRKLPETVRDTIDRDSAFKIMLAQPAIIKRPLLEHDGQFFSGFSAERYADIFATDTVA